MRFFENIREAVRRGFEAANNHIGRANKAEMKNNGTEYPQEHASISAIPGGGFSVILGKENPIVCGTKADGTPFMVSCFGQILFKAEDSALFEGKDQEEIVRKVITDTISADVAGHDLHNVKAKMILTNRVSGDVIEALGFEGFRAVFKLPLVLSPAS